MTFYRVQDFFQFCRRGAGEEQAQLCSHDCKGEKGESTGPHVLLNTEDNDAVFEIINLWGKLFLGPLISPSVCKSWVE